ncbi:magnesium transporter [Ferruginivarius sediminum]|uniref:Magnesium transporter MgtE n=1 Tax=Ferruginivarius sediminum TaxID=2661937 RepID=A0A369TD48_9PROT|nr:magnesium transporter [Ferruginivarius sediminum]RDD62454.1 magnesium transporter [Ferruginivarius sediminum]
MTVTPPEDEAIDPQAAPPAEEYGLSNEQIEQAEEALEQGDIARLEEIAASLHAADLADLIESLAPDERVVLLDTLGGAMEPEVLSYLVPAVRQEVIEHIGPKGLATVLSALESDDAVEIFEDLDEDFQRRILTQLPEGYRLVLEEGIAFPEESAGRLMQREVVAIPAAWTVGETIDFMRSAHDLPNDFYDLFVVDPKHKPQGYIPLSRVLRARRPERVSEIMESDLKTISYSTDQEEVAYLFRQYGLVSAPVVDDAGRVIGMITVDDIVHVIDEEAEDDLMKLAGVGESDLYGRVLETTKSRGTWLVVNLGTAVLASIVIGLFEATLAEVVALAVLMPIVASMGGNAGTQTLTVAVRALAMKDLSTANAMRFIVKELTVGCFNGMIFAVLTGIVAWLWFGRPDIGVIIGLAMIINMIVAGLAGTLVPLTLDRLNIDPAVASGVFLTTITDVVGFFAFLGLAALFIL